MGDMMRHTVALAACLCLIAFATKTAADGIKLKTLQTNTMRLVYYTDEHEYVIPHLARCFENSMQFHMRLFDYTPNEPVTVLLQDFDDYGFAGASTIPNNYLTIGIEPFEHAYEISPTNERINWVMSHELLHIVASDQATGRDRFFRKIFNGKVATTDDQPLSMFYSYLTSPRRYAPRWYHEGMAVFLETWMAGGYGRALGGYDEMVWRTLVADDGYFYDLVGLVAEGTTMDFQIGQMAYLYGTRFITYLAYEHGPEKVIEWVKRGEGSQAYYGRQFKQVYGRKLAHEWRDWIEFEKGFQKTNLDSIRQYPLTEYRPLSKKALGSASRAFYDEDNRKLYTAVLYPGEYGHIAEIDVDSWDIDKVCNVATPALYYVSSLAFDPDSRTIFFTTDNTREYRDLNMVQLDERKPKLLVKDCRVGDLAFNKADKSVWGVQHHNGLSHIIRFPAPYETWEYALTLPFGRDIFDIDISPDGKYLTGAMIEVSGRETLIRMSTEELMLGGSTYETLFEFADNSPQTFVYSDDGRYLYGTSYYTGVSNVFRYDFETQEMEAITNGDTGYFRPVPVANDSMIVFRYSADGFVPVMTEVEVLEDIAPIRFLGQAVVDRHPIVYDWMLPPPSDVNLDSVTTYAGDYRGVTNIKFGSIYPVVEAYKVYTAFGVRFDFMEAIGLHSGDATVAVTPTNSLPDDERLHAKVNYRFWNWKLSGFYNPSDFYDYFGPTKRSRKGYAGIIEYGGSIINDSPTKFDYSLWFAAFGGLEVLPFNQNVSASFTEYLSMRAIIHYRSYAKTIGAVDQQSGFGLRMTVQNNVVRGDNFPRAWIDVDFGFKLPWRGSSLWFRPSMGQAVGDRDEPLANFFFGAFGNNWVDHHSVKRYHEYYSYPGIEIDEAFGVNFGKLTTEVNLPPLRIKRFGVPAAYFSWARLSLFSTILATNYDSNPLRITRGNLGAQLDMKLILFSGLSTTLSFGYAGAVQKLTEPEPIWTDEFMISLKIL